MKGLILIAGICVLVAVATLWFWRLSDIQAERQVDAALSAMQPARPDRFDPAMVDGLPEPAQRYFRFTIRPGTPLYAVARITMTGQFSLGTGEAPDYMAMTAQQVLATPEGF